MSLKYGPSSEPQRLMATPSLDQVEIPERFDPDTADWISVPPNPRTLISPSSSLLSLQVLEGP